MPCDSFSGKDKDGREFRGIVCTRGRQPPRLPMCWVSHCSSPGVKLCDWPVGDGKTCDRSICGRHAKNVGPDKDYCPGHWVESTRTLHKM